MSSSIDEIERPPLRERTLVLNKALRLAERLGILPKRIDISTGVRWAIRGIRRPGDGQRVFLKTIRVGGSRSCRISDIEDFIAEISEQEPVSRVRPRSSSRRDREVSAAKDRLTKDGIR